MTTLCDHCHHAAGKYPNEGEKLCFRCLWEDVDRQCRARLTDGLESVTLIEPRYRGGKF